MFRIGDQPVPLVIRTAPSSENLAEAETSFGETNPASESREKSTRDLKDINSNKVESGMENPRVPTERTDDDYRRGDRRDEVPSDFEDDEADVPRPPGIVLSVLMNYGEGVGLFSLWRFPNMLVKHGGELLAYVTSFR